MNTLQSVTTGENVAITTVSQMRRLAGTTLGSVDKTKDVVAGPFLHLRNVDNKKKMWDYSIIVVQKKDCTSIPDIKVEGQKIKPMVLSEEKDVLILRYIFFIKQQAEQKATDYTFKDKTFTFYTPGTEGPLKMMGYSCNGTQNDGDEQKSGGFEPPWKRFLDLHEEKKYHVMLGGGDQIYCDKIWEQPSIAEWTKLAREQKVTTRFTEEMQQQVTGYYLEHYLYHFSRGSYAEAQAQVPSRYIWDDHDVFDGFGSFPPDVQNCPVFQGIRKVAEKYYRIFQQQQTEIEYAEGNVRPNNSSFVLNFGKMAILGLDTRIERRMDQIISSDTYDALFEKLENLPKGVNHLVVMASVPLVYPSFSVVDKFLDALSDLDGDAKSTVKQSLVGGLAELAGLKNECGTIDQRDDIGDHWNYSRHQEETRRFVERLQAFAAKYNIRITFLSGDVHVAAMGKFQAKAAAGQAQKKQAAAGQSQKKQGFFERIYAAIKACISAIAKFFTRDSSASSLSKRARRIKDPTYMPQIIASAITNIPAPKVLVYLLRAKGHKVRKIGEHTISRMTHMRLEATNEKGPSIVGKRNFSTVEEQVDKSLQFRLHVESKKGGSKVYALNVPHLNINGKIRDMQKKARAIV